MLAASLVLLWFGGFFCGFGAYYWLSYAQTQRVRKEIRDACDAADGLIALLKSSK